MSRPPAPVPTFYFIGVTTGRSSIMRVFPGWADHLGLDAVIQGIDCEIHDRPETYREIVSSVKSDPLSVGALVTTHKMDLLDACGDLFDGLGPYARLLGEVSSISKRNGMLWGHAKDPMTSGLALEAFVRAGYWAGSNAEVCILGAGGSSLALTTYLMRIRPAGDRPKHIVVTNRSRHRLDHMKEAHRRMGSDLSVDYVHATDPEMNDAVVNHLAPGSLVVNATGLGKDAPGSPLTDRVRFPQRGLIWEFNYRGELDFLRQAQAQREHRGLRVEDGWVYFVHGWTQVMAEVFGIDIPSHGPGFDTLSRIAREARCA